MSCIKSYVVISVAVSTVDSFLFNSSSVLASSSYSVYLDSSEEISTVASILFDSSFILFISSAFYSISRLYYSMISSSFLS